ncbi:50S ribosomal protein L29 [Candidatus Bathyarchaeota archaeon]|jgi:large subunit ribosomal protein L29|nr:50S ribosomal protein L29 [Candidatus Bathyarchaeota archaeon]
MPIMRLKEIRGMTSEERTKKISELKTELSRLKTMISAGGAVENPARIRELRKTIAQILTIENEKKQEPEKTETETKTTEKTPKTKEPKEKKKK